MRRRWRGVEARLQELLALAPANLAVRLDLVDLLVRRGEADSAVRQLEEVRRIPPAPPADARPALDTLIQLLRAGKTAESRPVLDAFLHVMRATSPYQASLEEVRPVEGPIVGTPLLTYAPTDLIARRGLREGLTMDSVRFTDVTDVSGLPAVPRAGEGAAQPVAVAAGDVRGDGRDNLFVSGAAAGGAGAARMFALQGGFATDVTAQARVAIPGGAQFATFADVDNDGWLDLFAIGADGRGHLLRNRGDGTFEAVTAKAGVGDTGGAREGAVRGSRSRRRPRPPARRSGARRTVYRNNLDGTFTEATAAFGLAGGTGDG